MKKKPVKNVDVAQTMVQIQAQLASLEKKLDGFINKSLTDIAAALAAQKTASAPPRSVPQQSPSPSGLPRPLSNPRPMFAVVCFECGKDCEIPFKPAPGRPVYCPECFAKRKAQANQPKPPVAIQSPTSPITKAPEPEVKAKKKAPAAKKKTSKKKTTVKKKSK